MKLDHLVWSVYCGAMIPLKFLLKPRLKTLLLGFSKHKYIFNLIVSELMKSYKNQLFLHIQLFVIRFRKPMLL